MVVISMMVSYNANAIVEYDRIRSGLSNAPLDMKYDNNITEIQPSKQQHRLSYQSSDPILITYHAFLAWY
mgnify:CR=1 FL=1